MTEDLPRPPLVPKTMSDRVRKSEAETSELRQLYASQAMLHADLVARLRAIETENQKQTKLIRWTRRVVIILATAAEVLRHFHQP